jgi:5-formyltetrahydrofolate cyclo-ligase
MSIDELKKALRAEAIARRAGLPVHTPDVAQRMAENFLKAVPLPPGAIVSAYIAIGEEANPAPLMQALRARGHGIALPRVVGKGKPLAFHLHSAGTKLVPGPFGLLQPAPDWPLVEPDVLAVPMLAFDNRGNRIGYGAGFYDRSLAGLRAKKAIIAAGFAFAGQEVAEVPHHEGDEKLDWIVTELGVRRFDSQTAPAR